MEASAKDKEKITRPRDQRQQQRRQDDGRGCGVEMTGLSNRKKTEALAEEVDPKVLMKTKEASAEKA